MYKYILTGTAVLNSAMDLFSQFRALDGGELLGKKFFQFRDTYFYDKNARMPRDRYFPKWEIKPGSYELLNQKIYTKAMRVTKDEALDLPDFVREVIEVELSPDQKKAYEEMRDDFITYIADKACVSSLAITKALRMQQIVSGHIPVGKDEIVNFKATPRQLALKELLEQLTPNHKTIVWAVFKENYKMIRDVCEELNLEYLEVHGEITNQKKFDNVDAFSNNPDCRVLIANPHSGGVGINLTVSDYSISFSRNFSLEDYIQAQSRSHRGGQTKKVIWIDIVCRQTIDELILEKLANKEEMGEKILTYLKDNL